MIIPIVCNGVWGLSLPVGLLTNQGRKPVSHRISVSDIHDAYHSNLLSMEVMQSRQFRHIFPRFHEESRDNDNNNKKGIRFQFLKSKEEDAR